MFTNLDATREQRERRKVEQISKNRKGITEIITFCCCSSLASLDIEFTCSNSSSTNHRGKLTNARDIMMVVMAIIVIVEILVMMIVWIMVMQVTSQCALARRIWRYQTARLTPKR
jgi:hypothetical protein